MRILGVSLLVLLFLSGCRKAAEPVEQAEASDPPAPVQTPTPTPIPTATPEPYTGPAVGEVLELGDGVRVEVLAAGRGSRPLSPGSAVTVRYVLLDESGDVIERSEDLGGEVTIDSLGDSHVFPGLDQALLRFHPGMVGRIRFPAPDADNSSVPMTVEIEVVGEHPSSSNEAP